ncbi:MAG: Holliday junction branch migration protein RuvA [Fimbriimonas sp.]
MIGRLRGILVSYEGGLALVDCAGVGYEVAVPDSVAVQFPGQGEELTLLIRQVFREDGVTLYGFLGPFQRRLFDLLLGVRGCGPKVGLTLIGQLGEETVASAIVGQDAKVLARATGVGVRLAERIILELKEKVAEEQFQRKVLESAPAKKVKAKAEDELVEALVALGYRRSESEQAAEVAREGSERLPDQIRLALRHLQRLVVD